MVASEAVAAEGGKGLIIINRALQFFSLTRELPSLVFFTTGKTDRQIRNTVECFISSLAFTSLISLFNYVLATMEEKQKELKGRLNEVESNVKRMEEEKWRGNRKLDRPRPKKR